MLAKCDIFVKQNILAINETTQDKILLKPKVYDQENLHGIPLTFVRVIGESWPTFGHFSVHECKLMKSRQLFIQVILTIFFLNLSDFYRI